MVRLSGSTAQPQGNQQVRNNCEGRGVKVPVITAIIPEIGRSNPGQGEIPQQRDGGPNRY